MADAIDFSKISPEQLAHMPAGVPPLGVTPNLVNPFNAGNYILIANSVLMAMMITFVALRFYVVFSIKQKMGPDDWTVVAALIGSCYYFVVVCLAVKVARFGTHMYNLSVLHMRTKNVALIGFMSNGPPHIIWPCIKTTFFLMYLQLFWPLTWLRRCVYVGLVLVWAWYVSMFVAQIAITAPPSGHGWVESFATPRYLRTFKLCVPTASFSLVSDVYILVLPLIAVSHLRLSLAKKIGVAAMFSTGSICCIASSLSVYFQHKIYKNPNDYTYYVAFVYLTYMLEMCIGISTSCMPSLARLHKDKTGRKFHSIVSSLGFPFRNLHKSTNISSSAGSKASTLEEYPKRSPYAFMKEDSIPGLQSSNMSHVESEPTLPAHQHFGQPLPNDRIHLSVDISQTVAAVFFSERDGSCRGSHPRSCNQDYRCHK